MSLIITKVRNPKRKSLGSWESQLPKAFLGNQHFPLPHRSLN